MEELKTMIPKEAKRFVETKYEHSRAASHETLNEYHPREVPPRVYTCHGTICIENSIHSLASPTTWMHGSHFQGA